jgi:hypothetical protein
VAVEETVDGVGSGLASGGVVEFDVSGGVGGEGRKEGFDIGTVDAILGEGSVGWSLLRGGPTLEPKETELHLCFCWPVTGRVQCVTYFQMKKKKKKKERKKGRKAGWFYSHV